MLPSIADIVLPTIIMTEKISTKNKIYIWMYLTMTHIGRKERNESKDTQYNITTQVK